eukprot:9661808-Lingulodinium_polyedra.AAC.1
MCTRCECVIPRLEVKRSKEFIASPSPHRCVVQCSAVRCIAAFVQCRATFVQCSAAQRSCNAVQRSAEQCVQCDAYDTIQQNTTQHNTIQHNALPYHAM